MVSSAPNGALAAPPLQPMTTVGPGVYRPLYPASPAKASVSVPAFLLDTYPVTNEEYARFIALHPMWRRNSPPRIFADTSYLASWSSDDAPGPLLHRRAPVVQISWFAARAYCEARQARLPTEYEWELAAAASSTKRDAEGDKSWLDGIATWYAHPQRGALGEIGSRKANAWGIHDLHGLIWEWVSDFNSTLVTGDTREGSDGDKMKFCGAGALGASVTTDYVKFMRTAFRSSLRADFTTNLLGFRCASDLPLLLKNTDKTP